MPTAASLVAVIRDDDDRQYKDILIDTVGEQQQFQPRNARQVKYVRSSAAKAKRIGNDSLVTLHELAFMIPTYVWSISTYPDLTVTFGMEGLLTEIASCENILLSYDTTFTLGDFYMSVLVGKFTMFNENPCVPLGFVLHDRKFQSVHADFFTRLPSRFPTKGDIIIVTDGECAIGKSIANALPRWRTVTCSNHILTDVEVWLKKRSASAQEISVYKCQLQELLRCESEQHLQMKIDTLKPTWTEAFVTYFDSHLKSRLEKGFSGFLKSLGLTVHNITTNMSESLNAVIKRFQDWEEASIDSMLLAMYRLQLFYATEINRSHQGFGPYTPTNPQRTSTGSHLKFLFFMFICYVHLRRPATRCCTLYIYQVTS